MQIFSFSPFGYEGALVAVEVDLRRGIPARIPRIFVFSLPGKKSKKKRKIFEKK